MTKKYFRVLLLFLLAITISIIWTKDVISSQVDYVSDANLRSIKLSIDHYKRLLRNSRWPMERFEYFRATDDSISPKEVGIVETMLLQLAFGFENEYVLMRSLNRGTEIEIRRGGLNKTKSNLKFFSSKRDTELDIQNESLIGCQIDNVDFLCVLESPLKREFVAKNDQVYTLVAVDMKDATRWIEFPWFQSGFLVPPIYSNFNIKDKPQIEAKGAPEMAFRQNVEIGNKISLSTSILYKDYVIYLIRNLALITILGLILNFFIQRVFRFRLRQEQQQALVRAQLEHFQEVQNLIDSTIHDIRSPLFTLSMLTSSESHVDRRHLMGLTKDRLAEIVNSLERKKTNKYNSSFCDFPLAPFFNKVILEKREEYREKNISISLVGDFENIWTKGIQFEFFRVISNIVNNAAEAFESKSQKANKITIQLRDSNNLGTSISISDNGIGMSSTVLGNVFEKNFSHGKTNGTGIGLWSAKKYMYDIGGTIEISSTVGHGTEVTLTIPRVARPSWSVSNLDLRSIKNIFIVDHDRSMNKAWNEQLNEFKGTVHYLSHPKSLPETELNSDSSLILIGNNFGVNLGVGLIYISQQSLRNAILVTDDWFLPEIQNEASKSGIKILGKEFMGAIKINV